MSKAETKLACRKCGNLFPLKELHGTKKKKIYCAPDFAEITKEKKKKQRIIRQEEDRKGILRIVKGKIILKPKSGVLRNYELPILFRQTDIGIRKVSKYKGGDKIPKDLFSDIHKIVKVANEYRDSQTDENDENLS